jgi:hypothetical protein
MFLTRICPGSRQSLPAGCRRAQTSSGRGSGPAPMWLCWRRSGSQGHADLGREASAAPARPVRCLPSLQPGSRRSRQRSALAWVYAGEHGPCGGLRVPTPSTASEKALPAIASSPPTLAAAPETARASSAPLSAADCLRLVEALQSVPDPRRARAVVTVGNRCFGLLCRR